MKKFLKNNIFVQIFNNSLKYKAFIDDISKVQPLNQQEIKQIKDNISLSKLNELHIHDFNHNKNDNSYVITFYLDEYEEDRRKFYYRVWITMSKLSIYKQSYNRSIKLGAYNYEVKRFVELHDEFSLDEYCDFEEYYNLILQNNDKYDTYVGDLSSYLQVRIHTKCPLIVN